MNKKLIGIILTGIIIIAIVLRFWQLGKIPISPDWDESALGYSAYSILTTGKDEYGKFLPVVLRSFDDYKPALYSYLIIPSIMLFDLNVYAVRFPSAFFGVLTVLATYFLVKELFSNLKLKTEYLKEGQNTKYKILNTEGLALLSAFLLAISPWHIQFSRVAFETNIGLALNVFAALFFLKGLKKPVFLMASSTFAALAIYVYQSEKVFTPLLFILLIAVYYKRFFAIPKKYIAAFLITGFIVVLPMLISISVDRNSLLRAKGTSIFAGQTDLLRENIVKLEQDQTRGDKLGQLLDNRRGVYLMTIAGGYLSHFDLNWLFISGDLDRHHAPKMGLLYLWELPFLLIGIYFLVFGKFNKSSKFLIFGWFLLAPVPASITTGVPHAVRTLNFLPTFQIFTAIGLITAFSLISNFKFPSFAKATAGGQISNFKVWKLLAVCYLLFAVFNFIYYLNQYFVQQNYFNAQQWQYGWEQAVGYVKEKQDNYKKIIISDREPLDRAYMFFAFYFKYPPSEYQKYNLGRSGGFTEVHKLDKYEIRPINWREDSKQENVLFVGKPDEFSLSEGFRVKKEIKNPDGTTAIVIVSR